MQRGIRLWLVLGFSVPACAGNDASPRGQEDGPRAPAIDAPGEAGGLPRADASRSDRGPVGGAADSALLADAGTGTDATTFDPGGQCIDGRWVPDRPAPSPAYGAPYAGLDDRCGAELARRLCEIVTAGYRSISYTQARQVIFRTVDGEGGMVQGVYDGLWHQPDHAEINIEHTWPQSLGATGVAKSDLHHLFATRADFNSARSNLPLGEVARHDWPATLVGDPTCARPEHYEGCFSMKGKDAEDVEVFEPRDAHKGNAARAILYFSIRYGSSCTPRPMRDFDGRHPEVTERVLKRWNALDPPDQHERDRNDRVQQVEQVRNPFIDHPELINRIPFQ